MKTGVVAALAAVVCITVAMPALAQSCRNNPAAFLAWLDGVRAEAGAAGISRNAVRALDGVTYDQVSLTATGPRPCSRKAFWSFPIAW